jgi:hypothetical protein
MGRELTPEEQALLNLYTEMVKLSDDTTVAGRFIFLAPDGRIVANGSLAPRDIEAATEALASVNAYKQQMRQDALPESLLDVDAKDVADLIKEAEEFLGNGGIV